MKDTVKEILAHPIATILIVGAIASAVASIVSATKGVPIKPLVDISLSK